MPRLFFQLHNGLGLVGDDEGVDLPSASAARGHVIDSIRSIMSAEIRGGTLDLTGYVDVTNEVGEHLQRITFMEGLCQRDGLGRAERLNGGDEPGIQPVQIFSFIA